MYDSITPQTIFTPDEFFEIRKNLRFKYFNQPDALQFTTIPRFDNYGVNDIARGKNDVYFFYYYINPKSKTKRDFELKDHLEKTIQKLINHEIEPPSINFQRIYDYFEELPSNISDPRTYFNTSDVIRTNQKDIKTLFNKYKKELLAINGAFKPQNNQQVWL